MANFSCSSGAGDAGGGNNHGAYGYGSVSEASTNTAGNYSTVNWSLSATYYCNSGWTWGGTTRSSAGYLDMIINGNVVGTLTLAIGRGWGNGTSIGSTSGQLNIGHANDGNGSCTAYIRIRSGNDPRGGGVVYYGGSSGTQTINLTTIPRASTPSLSDTVVAGNAVTVNTNRASSSFTHTLTYKFGSASGNIGSNVGDSVSWTPPIDLMTQIPNAKSGTGTITCVTYSGQTNIGTKSIDFTLNQPSDAAPVIDSSEYAETGTLADGNTLLSFKGVAATTVISQISVKDITITAEVKYSSTLKSITCTHNGVTQTATDSPAKFTFSAPVNTGDDKSYFSWTVTDSRGNTATGSISMDFVNYAKPIVATVIPERTNAAVSTGTVTIAGTFFNGKVGDIANDITVSYNYNDADHVPESIDKQGNNWSCEDAIKGVPPENAYTFTATVTDSLGFSSSKQGTLIKAIPTLWIGKETVRVNDYLFVGGKSLLDLTYPVGSIYMSMNSTDPGELFGGTWERLNGRFLLGMGFAGKENSNDHFGKSTGLDSWEPAEVGETGGNAWHDHTTGDHTLTVNEMPSHSHSVNSSTSGYSGGVATSVHFGQGITHNGYGGLLTNTGGGKGHNHGNTGKSPVIPPYIAVYMWKRTA